MHETADLDNAFIGGRWVPATGDVTIPVHNPADGSVSRELASASEADVHFACTEAAAALPSWSGTPAADRAQVIRRIAEELQARAEQLADAITAEVGTPRHKCVQMQVKPAVHAFSSASSTGPRLFAEERLDNSLVRLVPKGVAACITPWNYPLYQVATKVAAALMAGCTVVLKPSEVAPTCVAILADAAASAGLPPGVFNVVFGDGPSTGEALITHPAVDFVSFTGSTRAGARIAGIAGQYVKQVSLELGGKSASLVLPGAPLAQAVSKTLDKGFQNSGQTCAALTRLLVPEDSLAEVQSVLESQVASFRVGDPADPGSVLGPLATSDQRDKVLGLTAAARVAGAELLAAGPVQANADGYYVPAEAYLTAPDDELAQEEVFGPVLAVVPYADIDAAIRIANNSPYGLSGAVWAADPDEARKAAELIRTGSVSINGAPTHPDAPFGGFRKSGFGRERGAHGIQEFLTTQSIHF
ncbi:aldehyde dehydrogenase family protein [Sinomonas gamaensis]|uniref:aldehyde dehydrogenase family protein n=1 Tax=Sinomonas gamaensis TaxID=2565624 RepID=UPI00148756C0|nr:aldehyde dehydrogenase family protein [Sinomonas gamaensis]